MDRYKFLRFLRGIFFFLSWFSLGFSLLTLGMLFKRPVFAGMSLETMRALEVVTGIIYLVGFLLFYALAELIDIVLDLRNRAAEEDSS